MKKNLFLTFVTAALFALPFSQTLAHDFNPGHGEDWVACCLLGSVSGTPGGIGGSPTKFCEDPKVNFKVNSGEIGDQLFRAVKCDKYGGLVSDDTTTKPGHRHNKPGVSCHYGSRGFNIMCRTEAAGCEDKTCGRTRKAGS